MCFSLLSFQVCFDLSEKTLKQCLFDLRCSILFFYFLCFDFLCSYYNLTVQATDMNNYTDIATVIISIVRQSQLFHLFINSPPDVVKEKQDDLRKLLGKIFTKWFIARFNNNFLILV